MCRVAMRSKVSTATATAALPGGAWRTPVFSDVGALLDRRVLFPGVQGGVRGDVAPIARDVGYREARVREPARGDTRAEVWRERSASFECHALVRRVASRPAWRPASRRALSSKGSSHLTRREGW